MKPLKQIKSPAGIALLAILIVSVLPFPYQSRLEDGTADLMMRLRHGRALSDEYVFVSLSEADIQAMGGWPVSRDYFGYMVHVLTKLGAGAVGFDFLFDSPATHYPEYDRVLAGFLEASGRICLPMVLVNDGSDQRQVIKPLPLFSRAAHLGFSNLGEEAVIRRIPLAVDSVFSFGFQMARLFMGAEADARGEIRMKSEAGVRVLPREIRLNHFGDLSQVHSIGFLELLRAYERWPQALDFNGKIVLVAATSPSLPVIKATPLNDKLPASLLHLTAAENVITGSYLRDAPVWMRALLTLLLAGILWALNTLRDTTLRRSALIVMPLIYLGVAMAAFYGHWVLPLFFPLLGYCVCGALIYWQDHRLGKKAILHESLAIQKELQTKQRDLEEAQQRLRETESQLGKELDEKKALSEQSLKLAEEKRQAVLALEKQVRDLDRFQAPEKRIERTFGGIIHAEDSPMVPLLELIEKVASDNIPVVIQGDTGTGKELIARAIHRTGPRMGRPFIAVNCGALPENLLESELFGHEKGSFTGAQSRRKGRFELADGGTLFLDEITETSPMFQSKLLRVLQEGTFERVGGEKTIKVDVRMIAATNRDLKKVVDQGDFRPDLFYRLNGFTLIIPALKERAQDIPVLASHFLSLHKMAPVRDFSRQAVDFLQNYTWPGNVRELENVVRRAALLAKTEGRNLIKATDLPDELRRGPDLKPLQSLYQPLDDQVIEMMRSLKFSRSSISQTARALDNRDRGTVTEYFRGRCFEALVASDFNILGASKLIAGCEEDEVIQRVKSKIVGYVNNVKKSCPAPDERTDLSSLSCFKGLPQKFHGALEELLINFKKIKEV